jgi:hypothetical protein
MLLMSCGYRISLWRIGSPNCRVDQAAPRALVVVEELIGAARFELMLSVLLFYADQIPSLRMPMERFLRYFPPFFSLQ